MTSAGFFARHQSVRSLRHRDFGLLLAASTLQAVILPLHFVTLIFWVQTEYPGQSVLYVSLLSAIRGSAMLAFSLIGGAVADRFERRHVLMATESAACVVAALTAAAMLTRPFGDLTIVAVLGCVLLMAANLAIDIPARSSAIPAVVGMGDVSNAISLNMVAAQLTFPFVLVMVGALNSAFEPGQVFAGSLSVWLFTLPLIALLRFQSTGTAAHAGVLSNIRAGLSYTRGSAVLVGVLGAVFVVHTVGMPGIGALGPVWMTEVLGLSRTEFGFMAMTWGIGALLMSVFLARWEQLMRRGTTLCALVVFFGVSTIVFGHSRIVALTVVANFSAGAALIGVMMTATTLIQHVASEGMRGRVMGLFPLAMGFSMLNALPVGAVAQATSLELIVPILGWLTLGLGSLVVVGAPAMRRATLDFRTAAPSRLAPALELEGPA